MIDKGIYDKRFIWNSINCECECDKSCNVGEYLDYNNCKCRKRLVDKLIEECTENGEETKITGITLFKHKNKCKFSFIIYVVLIAIVFTICIGLILILFTTNTWIILQKTALKYDYVYQASNY